MVKPSCTMANATSGWMPTITVSAPRSLVMCAVSRSVRDANESMTSSAVTSTITPRERCLPRLAISASRSWIRSLSRSADWIVTIRNGPCLRMGASTVRAPHAGFGLSGIGSTL